VKCFYDDTKDAIGTCKSCGKGLSREFAIDLGKGLACKDGCEEDVQNLITLIDRNIQFSKSSGKFEKVSVSGGYASALFLLCGGMAFIIFGLLKNHNTFFIVIGAIFLIYGLFNSYKTLTLSKVMKKAAEQQL
jgi:hypothetical protein